MKSVKSTGVDPLGTGGSPQSSGWGDANSFVPPPKFSDVILIIGRVLSLHNHHIDSINEDTSCVTCDCEY